MSFELEERKTRYIEAVEMSYRPEEKTWWQHPPPSFHQTADYAVNYDKPFSTDEPFIIKRNSSESVIAVVLMVVAAFSFWLLAKNGFGFVQLLLLLALLIVVLPGLLENKALIRVSRENIWVYKENTEIPWENVLRTYIKIVKEENYSYYFIVHYYDERLDEFRQLEISLDKSISPSLLSVAIEAFRLHLRIGDIKEQ